MSTLTTQRPPFECTISALDPKSRCRISNHTPLNSHSEINRAFRHQPSQRICLPCMLRIQRMTPLLQNN
jgi:hypothetical protein